MRNKYFISIAIVIMMVSVAFSDYPTCKNGLHPMASGPHPVASGPRPTCKCLSKLDVECSDVLCDSVCEDDYGDDLIDVYCYNSSTCDKGLYNPNHTDWSGFYHLITALILYGYLIPISLYVFLEVVKILQAIFINQDLYMYDEETGTPAQCSIAGTAYGVSSSDVEVVASKQMAMDLDKQDHDLAKNYLHIMTQILKLGLVFIHHRIMNGNWSKESHAEILLLFLRTLVISHTAIPELIEETDSFNYQAESLDEGAFLVAARELGFQFCKRTPSSISVRERHPFSTGFIEREFKLLNLLDFTSKRKKMSVIVRDEDGKILLLCKGAGRDMEGEQLGRGTKITLFLKEDQLGVFGREED
ncbi:hypothetical protein ACET3Z_031862 [Daucus carota]